MEVLYHIRPYFHIFSGDISWNGHWYGLLGGFFFETNTRLGQGRNLGMLRDQGFDVAGFIIPCGLASGKVPHRNTVEYQPFFSWPFSPSFQKYWADMVIQVRDTLFFLKASIKWCNIRTPSLDLHAPNSDPIGYANLLWSGHLTIFLLQESNNSGLWAKKHGHLRQESSHFCTHKWLGVGGCCSLHPSSQQGYPPSPFLGVQSPWETLVLEWLTVKNGIAYKQVIPKSIGLSVFSLLNLLFGSIRPFSSIFRHPQITLKVKVLNVMLAVMFLQLGCSYPPTVEDKILHKPSIS